MTRERQGWGRPGRLVVALTDFLLRGMLRADDREFLHGDLRESLGVRRRERGDLRAACWYLSQALRSGWARRVASRRATPYRRAVRPRERVADLGRDLRFAVRLLWAERGFTLAAVVMLSLGVGGTTAIFSFVNGLLLKPLPYPDGGRLVELQEVMPSGNAQVTDWFNFRDWRERASGFEAMEAFYQTSFNALDGDRPVRISGQRAGAELFDVLRARPALGRTFAPGEDGPDAEPVAVISDSLWRRLLGADPDVLGRSLRLQGVTHTIIGVMPPGFHFREYAEVWVPHTFDPAQNVRGSNYWRVVARLRQGVDVDSARLEMAELGRQLASEYPEHNAGRSATALPLREALVGDTGQHAVILLVVVLLVQVIATVNVGNLLLARSLSRRREMAIRAAIGAGRARLIRQLLTESLLLAGLGGLGGVVLGLRGRTLILDSVPVEIPRWFDFSFDYRVAGFALLATFLAGVIFGLAPALHASSGVTRGLRDGDRGVAGAPRLRGLLVVSEVALTVVLLVAAGLMLKGAERTRRVDPGLDPSGVLTFRLSLPSTEYSPAEARSLFRGVQERLAASPGVDAVAAISLLPLSNSGTVNTLSAEGRELREGERPPAANVSVVDGDYFGALRVPIRAGRDLSRPADRIEVVVSEGLAARLWPAESAVGKRLKMGRPDSDSPWLTVIGIAAGVRHYSLKEDTTSETLYLPLEHASQRAMTVLARTPGQPLDLVEVVRAVVAEADPDLPVDSVRTMGAVIRDSMWQSRVYSWMFGVFATLALTLAVVGLYGLVAFGVRRQTREIGVRLALGAERSGVVRHVVWGAMRRVLSGIGIGVIAAYGFAQLISSLVFGVGSLDPGVYVGVTTVLLVAGSAAALLPALQAARVEPVAALQQD